MPEEPEEPTRENAEQRVSREDEVLAARRESLVRLDEAGVPAFALTLEQALGVRDPTPTAEIQRAFEGLEAGAVTDEVRTVAGRVVQRRDMGKLQFLVVRDRTGDIQLFCNAKEMDADAHAVLGEVDLGDIVGATGRIGTTKKGELSVFVRRLAMLTKSLRPCRRSGTGSRTRTCSSVGATSI